MSQTSSNPQISTTCDGDISTSALQRQNDIFEIISKVKWSEGNLYLLIPPTHHLIDVAFQEVKRFANSKGLYTERYRLTKEEVKAYIPTIKRKVGVYYVCIANSEAMAKASIEAVRHPRGDNKYSTSSTIPASYDIIGEENAPTLNVSSVFSADNELIHCFIESNSPTSNILANNATTQHDVDATNNRKSNDAGTSEDFFTAAVSSTINDATTKEKNAYDGDSSAQATYYEESFFTFSPTVSIASSSPLPDKQLPSPSFLNAHFPELSSSSAASTSPSCSANEDIDKKHQVKTNSAKELAPDSNTEEKESAQDHATGKRKLSFFFDE